MIPYEERTLAQRLESVDAVMHVRATGAPTTRAANITAELERLNSDVAFRNPVIVPITEYEVVVLEVVKAFRIGIAGSSLRVGTQGGRANWEGREIEAKKRVTDLVPGASYLLFLQYNSTFDQMMLGEGDIFRLDGPAVSSNAYASSTAYGKELVGRSPNEVMELVRQVTATTNR
jgi:hypothetical protein